MAAVLVDVENVTRSSDIQYRAHYLLSEVGCNRFQALVVTGQTVDATLDENQAELGVLVLPEFVQVLAHRHSLLDEAVQVLRELGGQACQWRGGRVVVKC